MTHLEAATKAAQVTENLLTEEMWKELVEKVRRQNKINKLEEALTDVEFWEGGKAYVVDHVDERVFVVTGDNGRVEFSAAQVFELLITLEL